MNIFKLKFKMHKMVNMIFYFIIFAIGFLCGNGTFQLKKLFFMDVKAWSYNDFKPDSGCFLLNTTNGDSYLSINNQDYIIRNLIGSNSSYNERLNLFDDLMLKVNNNGYDLKYFLWPADTSYNNYWLYVIFNGKYKFGARYYNDNGGYSTNPPTVPIDFQLQFSNFVATPLNSNESYVFRIYLSSNYTAQIFYDTVDTFKYFSLSASYQSFLRIYPSLDIFTPYVGPYTDTLYSELYNLNDYTTYYKNDSTVNNICRQFLEPDFDYSILDGSTQGKKLELYFRNFTSDMEVVIQDMYTGSTIMLDDFPTRQTYIIDNISFDSIYYVEIYQNGSIFKAITIDVANELNINGNDCFVNFAVIENDSNPRFVFSFENTKNNDICYINFANRNEQVDCGEQYVYTYADNDIPYNSSAIFYVMNNGSKVYEKGYTINLLQNMPSIYFDSSYNNENGSNVVNIITKNVISSDIVSYSYDDINYVDFNNNRSNSLTFYSNSPLYVKITRNGSTVASGYFYVNMNKFNNSSIDSFNDYSGTGIFNLFKNLSNGVNFNLLNYFSEIWNTFRNSSLFLYLNILVIGSFCVFIIKALRR